ncbi:glycosyltransferase family 2 protein [Stenotrophomonas sp. C3(2023)]|uniref:glycosyltransferase family 2 protein n=1 Tax=Stenotrophomonas sp. C3(2023) TaxID=3080277 RepID=UPI00293C3F20|nr:glycosyltransferase family 2 protein [Stenotrophomonas sp. C3(2023)]MDV3467587.1 glycosyltransferase family 2 protein [Stenotrophomonas sp. C3(2023)]
MKELIWLAVVLLAAALFYWRGRRPPSRRRGVVDAIVPAYNEGPCLEQSLRNLLANPYIARVICVDDGSTDDTPAIMDLVARQSEGRLLAIRQENTGKGGALMNGLQYCTADQVFLTDADTWVKPDGDDLGYLLAEIERGADAVGGIPSSDLRNGGLLPQIRASVKLPMITLKRGLQQLLGGAPFIISGACGMFRTDVLRRFGFSDRTKVEDLDLTWTLVANGFRVRQAHQCVVYPQECTTVREEWRRWRRWIVGYAVCTRLHWRLLFSRFGFFSMLPMVWVVVLGMAAWVYLGVQSVIEHEGPHGILLVMFPLLWIVLVSLLGLYSGWRHQRWRLVFFSWLAVIYVALAYAIWATHGLAGLWTGREPKRDKPTRYRHVVE